MKAKYLITALLTAAMAAPVLYAAEEGPEPRPPVEKKEMRRGPRRGPRGQFPHKALAQPSERGRRRQDEPAHAGRPGL